MQANETIEQTPYLTFSIGDEHYGVGVLAVREILEYEAITRVPRAPAYVRGVINLRGRVVPVVDLAVRFGMPASPVTKRSCIVIVEARLDGETVVMGLVVDSVSQVIELLPGEIEAPPPFGTRADVAYLKGLGRALQGFVLLLDIDRVLSPVEVGQVATLDPADGDGEGAGAPATSAGAALATVASALFLLLHAITPARAEGPIRDNSFLVEEAYNQERGVVQHVSTFSRSGRGGWAYALTQEWPLPDEGHQVSLTLPAQEVSASETTVAGIGDVALNYRYQAAGIGGGPLAFSPRFSFLLPTGRSREGLGAGGVGLQVNLPLSWSHGSRFVTHWNAGATRTIRARDPRGNEAGTHALSLGQSLVWLAHPKVNLLFETVFTRAQSVVGPRVTGSSDTLVLSPGLRFAHDFDNGLQIVPGIAFPIGIGPSRGHRSVFVYLSLEHPFRSRRP